MGSLSVPSIYRLVEPELKQNAYQIARRGPNPTPGPKSRAGARLGAGLDSGLGIDQAPWIAQSLRQGGKFRLKILADHFAGRRIDLLDHRVPGIGIQPKLIRLTRSVDPPVQLCEKSGPIGLARIRAWSAYLCGLPACPRGRGFAVLRQGLAAWVLNRT